MPFGSWNDHSFVSEICKNKYFNKPIFSLWNIVYNHDMKQSEITQVFAKEFGSSDVTELNKILKAKASEKIKFKLMGESLGYLGLTVAIKNITPEGLKIFDVNRVRLIRFTEIESVEKAKPKVPRPVYDKPKTVRTKAGLPNHIEKNTSTSIPSTISKPSKPAKPSRFSKPSEQEDEDEDFGETFKKKRTRPKRNFIPSK